MADEDELKKQGVTHPTKPGLHPQTEDSPPPLPPPEPPQDPGPIDS